MSSNIYYEDDYVTEYEDGTEEVRFSFGEEKAMRQDPVYFGYAAPCGHAVQETDLFFRSWGCPKCFGAHEAGAAPPPPDFPVILCGHCKGRHVGIGAVRRCSLETS